MYGSPFSSLLILALIFFFERKAFAERKQFSESTDFILCRLCGFNVAAASLVTNIKSPAALGSHNRTLFGVDRVLVQKLRNPLGIEFDVVTAKGGTCVGSSNTWQTKHTWFPGHAWKACTCSRCSRFIGWVFEPLHTAIDSRVYASPDGFYGFNLDNVISEADADSLVIAPKFLS